jgi:hypothetical protein
VTGDATSVQDWRNILTEGFARARCHRGPGQKKGCTGDVQWQASRHRFPFDCDGGLFLLWAEVQAVILLLPHRSALVTEWT